jgi:hypothetical protein
MSGIRARHQPVPDLLVRHLESPEWLLLEAKGHSFGPASSTAGQAPGLLVAGEDLREPLGLPAVPRPLAVVTYVIPEPDAGAMLTTLSQLKAELASVEIPSAPAAALGLSRRADGVYLHNRHPAGVLPLSLERLLPTPQRVQEVSADTDPRPLYPIPWDPAVDQRTPSARHGRRVLQERIRSAALSRLGKAPVPGTADLPTDELLEEATRGVYHLWRDRPQVKGLRREARRFLRGSLAASGDRQTSQISALPGKHGLRIRLGSEQEREAILDRLRLPAAGVELTAEGLT